jgi:hypothetical protein
VKLINTNTFNSYSVVLRFVQPQQILVHVDKATDEEDAIRQITEQLENNGITEVDVLSVVDINTSIKTASHNPNLITLFNVALSLYLNKSKVVTTSTSSSIYCIYSLEKSSIVISPLIWVCISTLNSIIIIH